MFLTFLKILSGQVPMGLVFAHSGVNAHLVDKEDFQQGGRVWQPSAAVNTGKETTANLSGGKNPPSLGYK